MLAAAKWTFVSLPWKLYFALSDCCHGAMDTLPSVICSGVCMKPVVVRCTSFTGMVGSGRKSSLGVGKPQLASGQVS